MATDYKALGKRISNARKQAGITQEALGEQLNMTRKHISVIESAIKRPSLDALVDIANALDVSTDDLLVDSLMHSIIVFLCTVIMIVDGDKAHTHERKDSFQITARFNVVSAEAR